MSRTNTRARIIEVALDLFARIGFGATTVTEIERQVGLKPGTGSFYRHFASKDALLQVAVDQEVEAVLDTSAKQRAELPLAQDRQEALAAHYAQILRDVHRFDRLVRILGNLGDEHPEVRRTVSSALGAAGAGSWTGDSDDLIAVAAISGYAILGQLPGGPFDGIDDERFISLLVSFRRAPAA